MGVGYLKYNSKGIFEGMTKIEHASLRNKCNSKGIFGRNDKYRTCLNEKFKTNNSEKVLGKFGHLIRVLV